MASKPTKRCHWVPQSYLKAFASDESKSKIWRMGKDEGDPEQKPIENVAVRFYLYVPKRPDGTRDDRLEKKFSDLENFFTNPVWVDFCNDFVSLDYETLRKNIALIVATMWLRTPHQFEAWKAMHAQIRDFCSGLRGLPTEVNVEGEWITLDQSTWPSFRKASEEDMKASWNGWLGQAWTIAEMLLDMRWSVIFHDEPVFITSDNPVGVGDLTVPFRGLKDEETFIHLPISPTRMLRLDRNKAEPGDQYYRLDHSPAALNLMNWRNAKEHIFSSRHPDEVCREIDRVTHSGFAM